MYHFRYFYFSATLHPGYSVWSKHRLARIFHKSERNLINLELSNEPIILCGDWNMVLNYHNDTINYLKENNPNAQKSVLELIDTFEMDDVYSDREPAGRSYTWSAYRYIKNLRYVNDLVDESGVFVINRID